MRKQQSERAIVPKLLKADTEKASCHNKTILGRDSVCTCSSSNNQTLCSFCDKKQQLQKQHNQDSFPIHISSKVFRLQDYTYSQTSEKILAANIEACHRAKRDLQALFQFFIEQVVNKSFERIECFSDFLTKDAKFKINNKLRHKSSQHQECWLLIIKRLSDQQNHGEVMSNSVEEIVVKEAEMEKAALKGKIDQITALINNLLNKSKEQRPSIGVNIQDEQERENSYATAQPTKVQQQEQRNEETSLHIHKKEEEEQCSIDEENLASQRNFCSSQQECQNKEQPDSNQISIHRHHDHMNHKVSSAFQTSPLINQSRSSCKAEDLQSASLPNFQSIKQMPQFKKEKTILTNKQEENTSQSQSFRGVELINQTTARIWKTYYSEKSQKIFQYLSTLSQVKEIVIQNEKMSKRQQIDALLDEMNWLEAIHIHASYSVDRQLYTKNIKQLSAVPTYSFLRLIDKAKYFICTRSNSKKDMKEARMLKIIKRLREQPFYNKMYIYISNYPIIHANIEELQFINIGQPLILHSNLFQISPNNNLAILSFINIIFATKPDFKHIFHDCPLLHTLVFDNCYADYNEIVEKFKYLRVFQLKHLQISCDGLDRKQMLTSRAIAEIFRLQSLQTLILTNIKFTDKHNQQSSGSSILKGISNLRELSYLNLYSSEPICNDLLTYISKDSDKKMELLNIGCSQVAKGVGKFLQKFVGLKSLCVDYTCIDDEQLLQATKEMQQLRFLSIENLNGKPVCPLQENNQRGSTYGIITSYFFDNMKYKNLQYINIFNCDFLKRYGWRQFEWLECIYANKGLLLKEIIYKLRQRQISVITTISNIDYNSKREKKNIPQNLPTISEQSRQNVPLFTNAYHLSLPASSQALRVGEDNECKYQSAPSNKQSEKRTADLRIKLQGEFITEARIFACL